MAPLLRTLTDFRELTHLNYWKKIFRSLKMMDVDAFTDSFVLPLWSYKYPRSSDLMNSSGTGKAAVLDECWVFSTCVGLTLVIVLDKD